MGSVGLNFGSPTSGQGFDVTTTVSAIVANLQSIETPWKGQLTSLQSQDTALTSIGSDLSTLSTAAQSLTDFEGVLAGKQGSSSNTGVLELTSAAATAVAGSHTVTVDNLASTASYYSDAVNSANDLLTGSFTVTLGGVAKTITASSGGESLSNFADTINSANAGVTAAVINGANGPELSIVSNTSGAAGSFTISGSLTDTSNGNATINLNHVGQTGQDANLTVDGIQVTSGSNTVSNAIQGVTFQLLDASASPVQVEITNDNSSVESAFNTFVTDYNTVIGDLNKQQGNDSSGNPEPLYGTPTVALLQEQMESALTFLQPAQSAGTTSTIASTDTLSGSIGISVGGGSAYSVQVGAGGTPANLAGLATAINNANLGVTASVITSGTSATLSLASSTSGSTGAITVDSSGLSDTTTGTAVAFNTPQSNAVTSLTQLGISVNNDGTLTLNTDTLDSILNSNYQDVVNFLQPSATFTSFGGNLTTVLNNLGNTAPNGAIYLPLQQDSQEETSLNTNITNENRQISTEQANLTTELNLANYELQQIPTQLQEINEIYSSITGYEPKPVVTKLAEWRRKTGKMNYRQQSLAGLNGIELIIALYDGMVRFLFRAIEGIEAGDAHTRRRAVKRVFDILIHLQARLRMDVGGTPAKALSDFYTAMFALALQGSQEKSKEKLLHAIADIRNVREAWQQVALDPAAQKMIPRNLRTVEERISAAALPLINPKLEHYEGGDGAASESYQWMA